jgi:alpha-tubulin suppressor-like RCC1 family protein
MTGFTQVSISGAFTCALKTDGTVWCWGNNAAGKLGDGTTTNRTRPVQVSGLTGVTSVEAGYDFTCALKSNGTVWCWGTNGNGQLGNGTTTNSSTPVQVTGLTNATQLATGPGHACVVKTDATVACWGWNVHAMLGDGTYTTRTTPVSVSGITTANQVRAGSWNTCVLLADQTITCWGDMKQFRGSGGVGSGSVRTSPTGISGVTLLSNSKGQHICSKLTDETVKCWGYNDHGQVGDNTQVDKNSPVVIPELAGVNAISTNNHTSCAIKADQTVLCWGWGGWNQLGNGSSADKFVPTAVPNVTGATQISAGYTHTCVLLADTSIQCWGKNDSGELGDGTTTSRSLAVSVLAPAVTLTAPSSITVTATASTAKSLDVSWGAVTGATSYTVKLYNAAGTSTLATTTGVTNASTTFNTSQYGSFENNTAYQVAVTAVGDGGGNYNNSVESAKVSGTTNLVAATPTISSHPAAVTRTYGQSATMSVTASVSDGGTLSYQWLKGGVSVSGGTTSSLVISSLELSDAGSFSVIVTNTLANALSTAVTSNAASLTVNKASQSTLTVSSTSGTYGSTISLTSSGGSGSGAVTFAVTSAGSAGCSISGGTTLNATSPGTCTVTATKASSANYLVASSSATTITFARQSQAALTVSRTNGDLFTGIILSISGGSGTGSTTSSVSSGTANCSLTSGVVSARAVGTCTLTVTKAADTNYLSETETFTLSFSKAVPTQGSFTTPTSGTAGSGINLNFAGGSGTGAITYTVSTPGGAGCSISNGTLNATNAGTCVVTITRAGDDIYASQSTNVEFTFAGNPMSPAASTSTTTTTTTVVLASATGAAPTTTSTTTTTTTTTLPKKQPVAPKLVNTASAAGAATIGGKTAKAKTSRVNNQLVFTAAGFTVTLAGVNADGTIIPLSTDGLLEVKRGDMFRLDAQGFAPSSKVEIWMFSKPVLLGTFEVGADGLVKSTLKVPKSVEDGLHHLVMVGIDKSNAEAKFEVGMNVGVPPKQWWYSRILIAIPISIAVFIGFWLPTSASRRRKRRA